MSASVQQQGAAAAGQRLDKWLFVARFARTRALAAAMIADGCVRLRGTVAAKAGMGVRPGDILTIAAGRSVTIVRITGTAERRGSADAARALYEPVDIASGAAAGPGDGDPRQSARSA